MREKTVVLEKVASCEEPEKDRESTDGEFPAAIRRGVVAAEAEGNAKGSPLAAAAGLDAKRAAVAAFEAACDAVERSGVVPRPTIDGPIADALRAARAGLARRERREVPIAPDDEVRIGSFNGSRGSTFLVSVASRWIYLRGGFAGRYDINTGFNERGLDCIDPVDLYRIRRMSGHENIEVSR